MLQKVVDIAQIPIHPSDTVRDYLFRVATWYQVPLEALADLLEKSTFGTGISPVEEEEFQAILNSLQEAAAKKGSPGSAEETQTEPDETQLEQKETPLAEDLEHQPGPREEAKNPQIYWWPKMSMPSLPDLLVGFSRVRSSLASARSRVARLPYQVTSLPASLRTQGRTLLAWRPTAGQLVTLVSLLFLYSVSLALHLPDRPTSFWESDAARTFSELVGRFPTGWDSFSDPAISPLGMLRHAHGIIQFLPGLFLISIVELFGLPLTDHLLDTFYIMITSAIVVPLYFLVRLVSGSRLVALLGVFLTLFMRADLRLLRIGGEAHLAFQLALSAVVLYVFYKYAQAPTRMRAWRAGLALGALWLSGGVFPFLFPAMFFSMVSAYEGPFIQRCRAVAKDALRPGVWVLPALAVGLHAWSYLNPAPFQDNGVFGLMASRGNWFPLAFRAAYLWEMISFQAPGNVPVAILAASLPGLWYTVRLHRSGILFVWGWTYLAALMLKFPRHPTETWNLFGVLPLVLLVLVMTGMLSRVLVIRFGWRPGFAAIPILVVFLVIASPYFISPQRFEYNPTYESGEAGTKSAAAYVRGLPNQGGKVVVWGLLPFPTLFYFTKSTVMPPVRPAPLLEVSECLRKFEEVVDTLVYFDVGVKRWYPEAKPDEFHRPSPPFHLVAVVEDDTGIQFASIYRKTEADVTPTIWNLGQGNQVFDTKYSRLKDLRQGPRGLPFQRMGGGCSSVTLFTERIKPYSACQFGADEERRAIEGQPLPSGEESNIHPNSSVEENLSFQGEPVRATVERSSDWAVEGSHSVKVTIAETTLSHRGLQTGMPQAFDVAPNTEYETSIMAKSASCGWIIIAAREFDREGKMVAYTINPWQIISETPTWLSLTFKTSPETSRFSIEVRSAYSAPMKKGFVYYYDNLQVWATGKSAS